MTLQLASLTLVGMLVTTEPPQAVTPMSRVSGQVIEDGTNRPVADGTPRGDPSRPKPALEPGTIEVTVDNADVSDLRIVVTGSQ